MKTAASAIALAAVFTSYRATGLPIVGMGGVTTGRHALELIAAGAERVALGTVLFSDPDAPERIRRELAAEAALRGFESPADARGVAHAGAAQAAADPGRRQHAAVPKKG